MLQRLGKYGAILWGSRWLSGKGSACNAGNMGLIPGLGRSPGWEDPLEE